SWRSLVSLPGRDRFDLRSVVGQIVGEAVLAQVVVAGLGAGRSGQVRVGECDGVDVRSPVALRGRAVPGGEADLPQLAHDVGALLRADAVDVEVDRAATVVRAGRRRVAARVVRTLFDVERHPGQPLRLPQHVRGALVERRAVERGAGSRAHDTGDVEGAV